MSYSSESITSSYKSKIGPRSTASLRKTITPGTMTRVSHSMISSGSGTGTYPAAFFPSVGFGIPMRPIRNGMLIAVNDTREKEKRELSLLNDKFASYIEKIRFLEAQNRKLQLELEALKNKSGKGTSKVKEMYEIEMKEARKLIDDTNRDRADAENRARDAEADLNKIRKRLNDSFADSSGDRKKIEQLQQEIAENEAKLNLLRRRLGDLDDQAKRYKFEMQRLLGEINKTNNELQNELFSKNALEAEKMALEDELNMIRQMHDNELNDIRNISNADTGLDASQFFRNELVNAIREIREEYENLTEQQRNDLQNRYMIIYNEFVMKHQRPELTPVQYEQAKIHEEKIRTVLFNVKNEIARLRANNDELTNRIKALQELIDNEKDDSSRAANSKIDEVARLKARLEQLSHEYDEVVSLKVSLEKEINQYRDLLEGSKTTEGLRNIVEKIEDEARKMEAERLMSMNSGAGSSSTSSRYYTRTATLSGSSRINTDIIDPYSQSSSSSYKRRR